MGNPTYLLALVLLVFLLSVSAVYRQAILTADGNADTYTVVNKAFGGTAEVVPDVGHCGHDLPGYADAIVGVVPGDMVGHKPEERGKCSGPAASAWLW